MSWRPLRVVGVIACKFVGLSARNLDRRSLGVGAAPAFSLKKGEVTTPILEWGPNMSVSDSSSYSERAR